MVIHCVLSFLVNIPSHAGILILTILTHPVIGWYGFASVKWLFRIDAVPYTYRGYQQQAYSITRKGSDKLVAEPVTRLQPRSLCIPPGIGDFFTGQRVAQAGAIPIQGRAWAGGIPIIRVEFSDDDGVTWHDTKLNPSTSSVAAVPSALTNNHNTGSINWKWGWQHWSAIWHALPGPRLLCIRATDSEGRAQPLLQSEVIRQLTPPLVALPPHPLLTMGTIPTKASPTSSISSSSNSVLTSSSSSSSRGFINHPNVADVLLLPSSWNSFGMCGNFVQRIPLLVVERLPPPTPLSPTIPLSLSSTSTVVSGTVSDVRARL
jgi:hypothetical protein